MPNMDAADETPPANFPPTPAVVLGWIAAAGDGAWFPLAHARQANIPRDSLDEPIAALRVAGLIRVTDWVKGVGQGFGVTPEGAKLANEPHKVARALAAPHHHRPDPAPRPTTFDRGEEARQAILAPRVPTAVPVLIIANVFWFLVGLVIAVNAGRSGNAYLANGDVLLLERLGAVSAVGLVNGEWWRLLSSAFVHIGILHLVLNMYGLASVGSVTESIWGLRKFLVLYAASAVGGGCLAMAVQPGPIMAGASGAIWGLMASLVAWLVLHRQHLPRPMVNESLKRLGVLLVINVMVSFAPGVSWAAHFGGGLMGVAVSCLFVASQRAGVKGRWLALALSGVLVAAAVGGLVYHTRHSQKWQALRTAVSFTDYVQYLKAAEAAMQPIHAPQVEQLYRAVNEVAQVNANKPDLPAAVAKLRADADAFAAFVGAHPRSAGVGELPERYAAYAEAVKGLADAMADVLREPHGSLAALHQRKRLADQRRAEIHSGPQPGR
jgi:membrane associated rhomboid family serine protease